MKKNQSPVLAQTPLRPTHKQSLWQYIVRKKFLYLMLIPCVLYFFIFNYIPMGGVIIAFKKFSFKKGIWGSPWIGFENFTYMFGLKDFYNVIKNSMILSFMRVFLTFPVPIILALMLNEVNNAWYQKTLQTIFYLPHFISWVVVGSILTNFLSPSSGVINLVLESMGLQKVFFMAETSWFRPLVILSSIWKEAGWGTIIYLAAITGVPTDIYEAARIDGASHFQTLRYITLPCIKSTIVVMLVLQLGRITSNGFEQIFILQNNMNLSVSEVFETYTYRVGLTSGRYSFATAVGLFTSLISIVFLLTSNKIANMLGEEGIW